MKQPNVAGGAATIIFAALVLVFLMAPLLIVVPVSFSDSTLLQFPPRGFSLRWYDAYLGDPSWLEATEVSLKVGVMVAMLSVVLATLTALGITRARFRGRALVHAFILSPLIVPVIILGVGLYYFFSFLSVTPCLPTPMPRW
jgi:putative spermidine/putrescine transport system permease protein